MQKNTENLNSAQQALNRGLPDKHPAAAVGKRQKIWPLLLAGMTALSFLTAVFLISRLHRTLPVMIPFSVTDTTTDPEEIPGDPVQGWGYLPPAFAKTGTTADGLFVLFADIASPKPSDRIMAAAMADMGFATVIIQAQSDDLTAETVTLVLDHIGEYTGIEPSKTALATYGNAAIGFVRAWSGMTQKRPHAGIILITPDCRNSGLSEWLAVLPRDEKLTIMVSNETHAANAGRQMYFVASGEDASLFPGLSGNFDLSAERYVSIDGQRRLIILPAYSVFNEGWSPRLHQAIQEALSTDAGSNIRPTPIKALYDRLLLPSWSLLLLAAVPLLLTLNRSLVAEPLPRVSMPNRAFEWLLYLPAIALAIPTGRLLAYLAGDDRLAEGYAFFALVGIYGWLFLAISAYRNQADREKAIKPRYTAKAVLVSLGLTALYLSSVYVWLSTVFESVLPRGRTGFVLFPVAIILLPAMLPATMPYRRNQARQKIFRTLIHLALPTVYLIMIAIRLGCATVSDVLFGLVVLIAGRVLAKALSFIPAPPMIASAAGSLLMMLMWPIPLV